jgi:hypothetical protein
MKNYNIVAMTEETKYQIIEVIRSSGAILSGVSAYGLGYYIQLNATDDQAERINTTLQRVGV